MSVDSSVRSEPTNELSKNDIWDYRDELIQDGFDLPEVAVIEALPATGKSRGSMQWAKDTGHLVTLLSPRHNLLDEEYEPWCEEFGLSFKRLPSFYRDCGSFEKNKEGDYKPLNVADEDLRDEYEQGYGGEEVHARNPHSSCQTDGECPYIEGVSFDPSEYDVLLGTYRHAHVNDWTEGRYIVFDEFPGSSFQSTFNGETESVISAYLQDTDDLPFSNFRDLLMNRDSHGMEDRIEAWKQDLHSSLSDKAHPRKSGNSAAHTHAPLATLALLEGKQLENGWLHADLGVGKKAVLNPNSNNWTFLLPPNLDAAESVIGLDGTPNEALWSQALNENIATLQLMDEEGKREYLQNTLGLRFIQTTERWKSIHSGEGAAPPKDLALIEGIAHRAGETPALISSSKALQQYRQEGLAEITTKTEHYNNLKGMNDFEDERLGIVLGSPHPGDDKIQKWCAFAGKSAEVTTIEGEELRGPDTDYGSYGNQVMWTFIHDEVLQAGMRFGREESDGEKGATVYLHTSAIPTWLPVEKQVPDIHAWTSFKEGMLKTVRAIPEVDDWQSSVWESTDVYPYVSDITKRTVRNCLDSLVEEGYLKFEGKRGQGTPSHYSNSCLEDAGSFGHVEFPL